MYSLRTKLFFTGVLISILPLFIYQYLTFKQTSNTLHIEYAKKLQQKTEITALLINQLVYNTISELKIVTNATKELTEIKEFQRVKAQFDNFLNNRPDINSIKLLGKFGNIIVSTTNVKNEEMPSKNINTMLKKYMSYNMDDVYVSEGSSNNNKHEIYIINKIDLNEPYFIFLELSLQNIELLLLNFEDELLGNKPVNLLSKYNNLIFTTSKKNIEKSLVDYMDGLNNKSSFHEDVYKTLDHDNEDVMTTYDNISNFGANEGLGWNIVTSIPLSDINEKVYKTLKLNTNTGLIIILVSFILLTLLSKSLSESINKILRFAKQLSFGEYSARLDENNSTKELNELHIILNDMAYKIDNHNSEIKKQKTKFEVISIEQKNLLSLFDKGDSVLFKWKNNENWSVEYVSKSAEKLLKYEIEDWISNNVQYSNCIHKDDLAQVFEEVTFAIKNNLDFFIHKPYRVITKNNDVKWVLDYTVTEKDENDEITHFIGYIIDITEQQNTYKELEISKDLAERANISKSEFLANMSHEIRTPLNAINGFIALLKKQIPDQKALKYINIIESSSSSLLNIINDILDISKMESGKLEIEKTDFEARKEFEEITYLFDARSSEKNITLTLNIDDNIPKFLNSDLLRIKQIISNLLSNAIKFTDIGKKIDVNITYKDKYLNVSVKDEGKGIAKDKQEHIFEAFGQEDTSTTREFGGTGLGLSISSKLLELLGGDIKLNSELGVGSEFIFSIPVGIGSDIQEKEEIKEDEVLDGKVLVVEDNKTNQLLIKILLEEINIDYDIANDGLEAVDMFKKKKYNLVLMDENMPNMSGIEATKHIINYEKENSLKHTPIIALTANALKGDRAKFLESGMDEYLTKPIEMDKLVKTMSIFLKK